MRTVSGFLKTHGFSGVVEMVYVTFIGVFVGLFLFYYFAIYRPILKAEKPVPLNIKTQLLKIILLVILLYFVWKI